MLQAALDGCRTSVAYLKIPVLVPVCCVPRSTQCLQSTTRPGLFGRHRSRVRFVQTAFGKVWANSDDPKHLMEQGHQLQAQTCEIPTFATRLSVDWLFRALATPSKRRSSVTTDIRVKGFVCRRFDDVKRWLTSAPAHARLPAKPRRDYHEGGEACGSAAARRSGRTRSLQQRAQYRTAATAP